jgi:hypothetical protein
MHRGQISIILNIMDSLNKADVSKKCPENLYKFGVSNILRFTRVMY